MKDLEKLGTEPISQDKPAGEDIRYEPEFEELQDEIDKLSSPTASGAIDWKKIEDLSSSILAERSKDMLVAAYLSVGLTRNRGPEGLLLGTKILRDLIKNFWDTLFPPKKRKRGRIRILEWWIEKISAEVERLRPFKIKDTELAELTEALDDIDRFLEENLPDHPSTLPLSRLIEQSVEVEKTEKEEPKAAEEETKGRKGQEGPAAAPSTAAAAVPASGELEGPEDAKKALSNIQGLMKKMAAILREHEPASPLGYRLLRQAIWTSVMQPPPADSGVTKIPPPPNQVKTALVNLSNVGEWQKLVNACEANLVQRPLWLDLNRHSAAALRAQGSEYEKAAQAVEGETSCLMRMVPELAELKFSDGTPLADDETKAWLASLTSAAAQGSAAAPVEKDPFTQAFSKAQALAASKQLSDALALLQEGLKASPSMRDRFRWRILIVKLLVQAKKQHFAYAHINEIIREIDEHGLEQWEPELAFEGLQAAWQGLSKAADPAMKKRAREIVMRMSGLDTRSVLEIIRE